MFPTNAHRRRVGLAVAAVLCVLTLAACFSSNQQRTLSALNKDRRTYGLRSLPAQSTLQRKAQAWANRLASENRLYHSTLTSGVPSCWRGLGENVGYGSSVEAVQAAYMRSSGHRANILASKWDWVGVGVARNGSRVFTVQVFMDGC